MRISPFAKSNAGKRGKRLLRIVELIGISLIILLAALLRLVNNDTNPGWYADEATHVLIADQLAQGTNRYMAVSGTPLMFAKMPAFDLLLAALFRLGGSGIGAARDLTAVMGVITVMLVYFVTRRIVRDPVLSLWSASLMAVFPQAVLYSRIGFSYNLLVPFVLVAYYALWEYARETGIPTLPQGAPRGQWLLLAAAAIGLGTLVDLWMFSLLLPMIAVVMLRHPRHLIWAIPLLFLPILIYAGINLAVSSDSFLFDMRFTLSRLAGGGLSSQLRTLAGNYSRLLLPDLWLTLAIVGLFFIAPPRLRLLTAMFFLFPIAFIGRSQALFSLSAYYMIPLLPFAAISVGTLLRHGLPRAHQLLLDGLNSFAVKDRRRFFWSSWMQRKMGALAWVLLLLLAVTPFAVNSVQLSQQVMGRFQTAIDPFLVSARDAGSAAAFLNARLGPEDLVIASPGIAWLLDANTADPQMTLAFAGKATPHLPAGIPRSRFAYSPAVESAAIVIIDDYWRNWAYHNVAGLTDIIREINRWPMVLKSGTVEIYANPNHPDFHQYLRQDIDT